MKTVIAAVALATVFAAPAFAQTENAWKWKGSPYAAPASATSAYAAPSFNGRRGALAVRRGAPSRLTYTRDCNVSPASLSYRTNCN
jgi:hypothetical protein